MAKTKQEKIEGIQEQIAQLENQKKRLIQEQKEKERKDRTRRLCQRAGLLESLIPDTIPLTDEQFKIYLQKTLLSDYSRRILDGITAQKATADSPQATETAARDNPAPAAKPPQTAQGNATGGGKDGGNGARATG